MLQFVKNIENKIQEDQLVKREDKLLLQISGGKDSICMLFCLYLLKRKIGLSFDLIWFNHFWQKSSFFTMLHLSKSSRCFFTKTRFVLALTQLFSEQSARSWRYSVTQRLYSFYKYDAILLAHNKSDRVETVLFNLVRGAGLKGVSALSSKRNLMSVSDNNFYPLLFEVTVQTHFKNDKNLKVINISMLNKNKKGYNSVSTLKNDGKSYNLCNCYFFKQSLKVH